MPIPLNDIQAEALKLPAEDKWRLVSLLLESLEPEPKDTPEDVAKAWEEEIARRVQELDEGRVQGIPFEQVMAEMRAMIEAHGR